MRLLITGASGFIGSHFVRLASSRAHELMLVLRSELSGPLRRAIRGDNPPHLVPGTLADLPWDVVARFNPDACVHAAWISTPGVYLESAENELHVQWGREFIRRLSRLGCGHVVALGTCVEYATNAEPLREDASELKPSSLYARCKDRLRQQAEEDLTGSGTLLSWARIFYPYGPGEHLDRLCSHLITQLSGGSSVELRTPRSLKDYIHVDDVAAALMRILETRASGSINVGRGVGVQVGEIARMIARLMRREELLKLGPVGSPDPGDCVVADIQRLRALGWKPQVPLELGLQGLIQELAS